MVYLFGIVGEIQNSICKPIMHNKNNTSSIFHFCAKTHDCSIKCSFRSQYTYCISLLCFCKSYSINFQREIFIFISMEAQSVVVIQDASNEVCWEAIRWVLQGLSLKTGDKVTLLSVLTRVQNPKSRTYMGTRKLGNISFLI